MRLSPGGETDGEDDDLTGMPEQARGGRVQRGSHGRLGQGYYDYIIDRHGRYYLPLGTNEDTAAAL